MSINGILSNAMSGLNAAARAADVVSSNLANAMTEGYGRRELDLSSRVGGSYGGVRIDGVSRWVDAGVLADRWLADAGHANADMLSGFHSRLEGLFGVPTDPHALSNKMADFEASLVSAASLPESVSRLEGVATRASDLAAGLARVSDGLQDMRESADTKIDAMVKQLNGLLGQVRDINTRVTAAQISGRDTSALLDQRQKAVDGIAEIVPVRQVDRDRGQVALYSTGGAILLDGRAVEVEFDRTQTIMPYMTVESGLLSGLSINGIAVRTGADNGALRGGALSAQFQIRDELAVQTQEQIDAVARDLVERFQTPSVDPTLGAGDAGLFTDRGLAFDPADETGLAGRIAVNTRVSPAGDGDFWRLRDGLGAAGPGNTGDATLLQSMSAAMSDKRVPASGDFGAGATSAAGLSASLLSQIGADRLAGDRALGFASAQRSALRDLELADGVDTDQEMQRLMMIENAYAANARVAQTADEMMQAILRI